MPTEPCPWTDEFSASVKGVERFLNITTGSEIQVEAIALLGQTLGNLQRRKECAIRSQDEETANEVLGCECVITALRCELQMWVALKKDDSHAAWNFLVDAQVAAESATRAHPSLQNWNRHHDRLLLIQELIYPRQLFTSIGGDVTRAQCSICEAEYGACEHIRGRAYMGEFCSRIIQKVNLSEVSLVEEPADKACRVTSMSFEGAVRDTLTWRAVARDDRAAPAE